MAKDATPTIMNGRKDVVTNSDLKLNARLKIKLLKSPNIYETPFAHIL